MLNINKMPSISKYNLSPFAITAASYERKSLCSYVQDADRLPRHQYHTHNTVAPIKNIPNQGASSSPPTMFGCVMDGSTVSPFHPRPLGGLRKYGFRASCSSFVWVSCDRLRFPPRITAWSLLIPTNVKPKVSPISSLYRGKLLDG